MGIWYCEVLVGVSCYAKLLWAFVPVCWTPRWWGTALVVYLEVFTNFDIAERLGLPVDDSASLAASLRMGKKQVGGTSFAVIPEVVGFVPDARQVILKCSRQSGKSSVTALQTLRVAMGGADRVVVVMTPRARQSGEFLR